jgi:hypothetical protein
MERFHLKGVQLFKIETSTSGILLNGLRTGKWSTDGSKTLPDHGSLAM